MPNMLHRIETAQTTPTYRRELLDVMMAAHADDDIHRLAAINRYDISPDREFDRITALAADLFDAPIALLSIVEHDSLWLKSHHGLDAGEVGGDPRVWASAILTIEPLILTDAKTDVCSLANPFVAEGCELRFYVGVLLRSHEGHNLGTLCVIDREPRQVDERKIHQLKILASIVMDQLELRLSARRAVEQAAIMTTMASEVDHRMMNSLQFISSLLKMQSRMVQTSEAADQLTIAANRISAVARVHRHYSVDEAADGVSILPYLRRLCSELSGIMEVDIEVDGVEANIPAKQTFAIGLVMNELVTNAKKHGAGPITITFTSDSAGQYQLCVADEGNGLPEGFAPDWNSGSGLGMKVVTALVSQLGGRLSAGRNPAGRGACFTATFPGSSPVEAADPNDHYLTLTQNG
jgi:two-component sensor histidine kinase